MGTIENGGIVATSLISADFVGSRTTGVNQYCTFYFPVFHSMLDVRCWAFISIIASPISINHRSQRRCRPLKYGESLYAGLQRMGYEPL